MDKEKPEYTKPEIIELRPAEFVSAGGDCSGGSLVIDCTTGPSIGGSCVPGSGLGPWCVSGPSPT
jgi:hypothetical protein